MDRYRNRIHIFVASIFVKAIMKYNIEKSFCWTNLNYSKIIIISKYIFQREIYVDKSRWSKW